MCKPGKTIINYKEYIRKQTEVVRKVKSNIPVVIGRTFFFIICTYNVWVISPPFPLPSTSSFSPPTPSFPGRNYFALLSNFVEERI
jgi:hypothetical protein